MQLSIKTDKERLSNKVSELKISYIRLVYSIKEKSIQSNRLQIIPVYIPIFLNVHWLPAIKNLILPFGQICLTGVSAMEGRKRK